jgi:hypothetical protein
VSDSYSIDFTNKAAFDAMLADVSAGFADMRDPLGAGARELVSEAQANSPKRSGRLAASHQALAADGKRIRIVATAPYAAAIHWGYPRHGIRRQPWLVATWLRSPNPMAKITDTIQARIDKAAART